MPTDLVQGTLDLLILKVLALEPMHGWAIARHHLEREIDEGLAAGLPPDEASFTAWRSVGAVGQSMEECRWCWEKRHDWSARERSRDS